VIQMLPLRRHRYRRTCLDSYVIQAEAEHSGDEKDEPEKHDHVHF
jgi:hypothetical protein